MGSTPLRATSTPQYNTYQLVIALSESAQITREIRKASTSSKTYYG